MNNIQASPHGKLRRTVAALMAMLCVLQPAHAQIVADPNASAGKRPVVDNTANGRPLVQIATPSAAGVSHNQYSQFNVAPGGAILNNARDAVLTQQGGYVGANPNLQGAAARVILNEVTSASPSQLRGYTEVAGQRAEVVIANPNGISCDGCGFINTSRGVLTTGVPLFGGDGSLEAFRVTGGAIQVGAGGMNGANMDQLDLIARSVQVNGELWADKLNVVTGANRVNYSDLGLSVIAGEGNVPTIGLDVARMGGMYANKIMLLGTENGVGVRSLGTLAAQAGSFTLTSKGQIELAGKTTASDDLVLKTDGNISNSGVLYAGKNTQISGAQISNSGTLSAQGDLSIDGAQLNSSGTLAAGVDQNGNLSQTGKLTVTTTGDIATNGTNQAGADLSIAGSNVDLSGSTSGAGRNMTISAQGDVNAGGANINAAQGNLNISGRAIKLDGSNSLAGGDIVLSASGALGNRGGVISSAKSLSIQAASVDNTGGRIAAATDGAGSFALRTVGDVANDQGQVAAGADLSLAARTIQGSGSVIGNGDVTLDVQTLSNNNGSIIQSNNDLRITASGAVRNAGELKAVGALNIGASGIENTASGDNRAALTSIAPEFFAAVNWKTATIESGAAELEARFGLSGQAALMLAATLSEMGQGSASFGQKAGAQVLRLGETQIVNGVSVIRVGRWMSADELQSMQAKGSVVQGAGGQTYISVNGPADFKGAASPGSVYVEFDVPKNSLLQGGKDGWMKMIGPEASKSQQYLLNKQNGSFLPEVTNIKILDSK